jgi:type II secretion system (T2SS) protein E
LPKTLGEIAIDAGLVNKAGAARAGKLSEEKKEPLVVVLVRELGVDELALVGALRKQTRVPLLDPASTSIDAEALRLLSRDICARLRVLPIGVATDGTTKVMRIAMADPTDTAAVAELEQLTHCEIDVSALPLSAIEELVDKGYRQVNTAVVSRPVPSKVIAPFAESETSVTAQIPMSVLQAPEDLEQRVTALISVLVAKGIVTEAELIEALAKLKSPS